jgi:hypothetical protein
LTNHRDVSDIVGAEAAAATDIGRLQLISLESERVNGGDQGANTLSRENLSD